MKSDQSVAGRDDSTTVQHSGESKDKGESGQGSHAILRIGTLRDVRVEWAVAFPAHHVHGQDCSTSAPVPALGKKQTGTRARILDWIQIVGMEAFSRFLPSPCVNRQSSIDARSPTIQALPDRW